VKPDDDWILLPKHVAVYSTTIHCCVYTVLMLRIVLTLLGWHISGVYNIFDTAVDQI